MTEERVLAVAQLSRPQRVALDDYWQQRMMLDPALRSEWQAYADRRTAELRPRPAVAPPPDRIVVRTPEQPAPVVEPDETQMVDPRLAKPSLPFDTSKAAQPIIISASPRTPSPSAGFTIAGSSGARPSMPFARLAAPNPGSIPPDWTIARYAALCFDLHASGMPEEKVLAMAQITRDQRLALDAYWQNRMNEEPALRVEWKGHADQREAELRASRTGR